MLEVIVKCNNLFVYKYLLTMKVSRYNITYWNINFTATAVMCEQNKMGIDLSSNRNDISWFNGK